MSLFDFQPYEAEISF